MPLTAGEPSGQVSQLAPLAVGGAASQHRMMATALEATIHAQWRAFMRRLRASTVSRFLPIMASPRSTE